MTTTHILYSAEVEDLAGRVTNAAVTAVENLAAELLTDPQVRAAVSALTLAVRDQLAANPVDPAPMVRAILRHAPSGRRLADDEEDEFGFAITPKPVVTVVVPGQVVAILPSPADTAPAYWPAVPAISDELFAEYAAANPEPSDDDFDEAVDEGTDVPVEENAPLDEDEGAVPGVVEDVPVVVVPVVEVEVWDNQASPAVQVEPTSVLPTPQKAQPFPDDLRDFLAKDQKPVQVDGEPVVGSATEEVAAPHDFGAFYARPFGRKHKARQQ